jgi:hypothetical protein
MAWHPKTAILASGWDDGKYTHTLTHTHTHTDTHTHTHTQTYIYTYTHTHTHTHAHSHRFTHTHTHTHTHIRTRTHTGTVCSWLERDAMLREETFTHQVHTHTIYMPRDPPATYAAHLDS